MTRIEPSPEYPNDKEALASKDALQCATDTQSELVPELDGKLLAFCDRSPHARQQTSPALSEKEQKLAIQVLGNVLNQLYKAQNGLGEECVGPFFPSLLANADSAHGDLQGQAYRKALHLVLGRESGVDIEHIRDLGFSALRSGYETEGHELLRYFIHKHGVIRFDGANCVLRRFLTNVAAEDSDELHADVLQRARTTLEELPQIMQDKFVQRYTSAHGAFFSDSGNQQIKQFFREHFLAADVAERFHDLALALRHAGEYEVQRQDEAAFPEHPLRHLTESASENLVFLRDAGSNFASVATALEERSST